LAITSGDASRRCRASLTTWSIWRSLIHARWWLFARSGLPIGAAKPSARSPHAIASALAIVPLLMRAASVATGGAAATVAR